MQTTRDKNGSVPCFHDFRTSGFHNLNHKWLINVLLRVYMYIYSIPLYRPTVPHCIEFSFKHSPMTTCNRTFSAKWLALGERLFSKAAKILFPLNKYRAAKSPWRIREGLIRNRKELRNWRLNTQEVVRHSTPQTTLSSPSCLNTSHHLLRSHGVWGAEVSKG